MGTDRLPDGTHLARSLATEIESHERSLADLCVVDAATDVGPTPDGTPVHRIEYDGDRVATLNVQPDRAYVEFDVAPDTAAGAADSVGLRVRPKAVRPPRTLVFVESRDQVDPALDVFEAVRDTLE